MKVNLPQTLFIFLLPLLANAELPENFVYVQDIDPTIVQSIRYTTTQNFIGQPIDGYKVHKAILTLPAAVALSKVQKELVGEGYSLVIYDAYRPQKAVDHFVRWAEDLEDEEMKAQYYPRIAKEDLFELDYIAEKSGHSRGSTVDISIIPLTEKLCEIKQEPRTLEDHFVIIYLDDCTLDMGSGFDLFDLASHPDSQLVTLQHHQNRIFLQEKMLKHGFKEYHTEWWHFTLVDEPFPDTYFDFDVE